jgi:hypothetical protein
MESTEDLRERFQLLEAIRALEGETASEKLEDLHERIEALEAIRALEEQVGGQSFEDLQERLGVLEEIKSLEEDQEKAKGNLLHTLKTSDGRPWGDVKYNELAGMVRDGEIARERQGRG